MEFKTSSPTGQERKKFTIVWLNERERERDKGKCFTPLRCLVVLEKNIIEEKKGNKMLKRGKEMDDN